MESQKSRSESENRREKKTPHSQSTRQKASKDSNRTSSVEKQTPDVRKPTKDVNASSRSTKAPNNASRKLPREKDKIKEPGRNALKVTTSTRDTLKVHTSTRDTRKVSTATRETLKVPTSTRDRTLATTAAPAPVITPRGERTKNRTLARESQGTFSSNKAGNSGKRGTSAAKSTKQIPSDDRHKNKERNLRTHDSKLSTRDKSKPHGASKNSKENSTKAKPERDKSKTDNHIGDERTSISNKLETPDIQKTNKSPVSPKYSDSRINEGSYNKGVFKNYGRYKIRRNFILS